MTPGARRPTSGWTGGFFLLQRGRLTREGTTHTFLEVIGFERGFGATGTPADITSRVYTTTGDTLDYTYEADGGTVTIWGGAKGSPAAFRGTWNEDRTELRGAWEWPGGRLRDRYDPSGWLSRDAGLVLGPGNRGVRA